MTYEVSKYPQGTFSWCDIASTDIQKSKEFLTSLFGWTSEDMPTGEGRPDYTMFYLDRKSVAGGMPAFDPNITSFWASYVSVDNIDQIESKVESLGGKILMPSMQVLDSGRMATIQDPTGAILSLWQPQNHIGAQVVNKVGAVCWNELYTRDIEKAKQFYGELLGWTFSTDQSGYTTISNQNRSNGGIFQITEGMQMPPAWMIYFTVADLQEAVAKTQQLGGKVWMEQEEISVGKIATISEPTGAGMILIEMSVEPEPWSE